MSLKCELCDFTTKPRSNYQAQELGRHMKFVHGQPGASASSKTMQLKKAAVLEDVPTSNPTTEVENASTTTANAGQKRSYNKSIKEDDAAILVYVGYIKAGCEAEATKLNIAKEQFTRRVAELFYAYSLR